MIKVKINNAITVDIVNKILSQYHDNDICIVIQNTKEQSSYQLNLVARKYPNIVISVLGGLSPDKKKYNNEYYQERTYFTPMELSKVLLFFENLERKINPSWTDTQKVMFVYQLLCNNMEYLECFIGKKDISRSLLGVIYGKAVCVGFALIFKEVLDRLGIECIYQNMQHHHSWNVAYLDGEYRAFDLTWDCYEKPKEGCQFKYFNRFGDFYLNSQHNLKKEKEEKEYPIVPYTQEELEKDYKVISSNISTISLEGVVNLPITIKGQFYSIRKFNNNFELLGNNVKTFTRNDGSKFSLISFGLYKGLNSYYYLEFNKNNELMLSVIYSEIELDKMNIEYDDVIANSLLSSERVIERIKMFYGYVGYIDVNKKIFYNDAQTDKLNMIK